MSCNQKEVVVSEQAPKAIGPYSPAIKAGDFVFVSGSLGFDPSSGKLVAGGVEAETRQVLTNMGKVLESAGSSLDNVVKTTVYLRDINDFASMNRVYAEFFKEKPPARSTFQVGALPAAAAVEIDAIALLQNDEDCSEFQAD